MKITTTREIIGPKEAKEMLAHNSHNRPIRRKAIDNYARLMRESKWGEGDSQIVFAEDGTLLNGQHRLMAVVASDTHQAFDIKRGAPMESQNLMDVGIVRRAGDALTLAGFRDGGITAAAIKLACSLEQGTTDRYIKFSSSEIVEFAAMNPDIFDAVSLARRTYEQTRFPAPGITSGVYFVMAKHYGWESVFQFADAYSYGSGLAEGDPALTLRKRTIGILASHRKPRQGEQVYLLQRAMLHRVAGNKITRLVYDPNEAKTIFPEIGSSEMNFTNKRKEESK